MIKQANQMDVIPCFSSNVSNKNCWPSNRRSGLSTYTSGDLRVPGQTAQVVKILIILQGHDVFGGLKWDSSDITLWYFFGLFKQYGIGIGYQWCDHGCSWLCLHTNSTEVIVWAKSQSLLSNALHLIIIIFSLVQVLKLSNHEGKTASSSYRIPRPP